MQTKQPSPQATPTAFNMASSSTTPLPIYGSTKTTTFTTTIIVTSNQQSATIYYADPPITAPLSYTKLPSITGIESLVAGSTSSLPILVLTDVVGIIVGSGTPIATRTLIQPPPTQGSLVKVGTSNNTVVNTGCLTWNCWTQPQRIGTGFGIVLASLAVLTFTWWACLWRNRRKVRTGMVVDRGRGRSSRDRDVEEGNGGGILLGTGPQRGSTWRRRASRSISGSMESSSSGEATGRTRGRDQNLRAMQVVPTAPVQGEDPATAQMPNNGPNLNRFSNIATAAVVGTSFGAAEAARRRASSPPPIRPSKNRSVPSGNDRTNDTAFRGTDRPTQAPGQVQAANSSTRRDHFRDDPKANVSRPPMNRAREQVPERHHSARESQRRGRERRSRRRGRDEDSDRNDVPPRRVYSVREGERSRFRSLSAPRHSRSRSSFTDRHHKVSAKWMALLPLALTALYELAEPNGGWEKHIPKDLKDSRDSSNHDHNPRARNRDQSRSFKPLPSRSKSVDFAYNRYGPPKPAREMNKETELRGRSMTAERVRGAPKPGRAFSFSPSPLPRRRSTRRSVRTKCAAAGA